MSERRRGGPAGAGDRRRDTLGATNQGGGGGGDERERGEGLLKEYDDPVTKPTEVAFASNKKVRWKCSKCKHKWEAVLSNRTNSDNPTGCPSCAG